MGVALVVRCVCNNELACDVEMGAFLFVLVTAIRMSGQVSRSWGMLIEMQVATAV